MVKRDVRIEDLDDSEIYALSVLYNNDFWKDQPNPHENTTAYSTAYREMESRIRSQPYVEISQNEVRSARYKYESALMDLEKKGLARAKQKMIKIKGFEGAEDDRKVVSVYTLTKSGKRLGRKVWESHPPVPSRVRPEPHSLTSRVSAFLFLLAGLVFMALPDFTTTGNVIGSSSGSTISFFLSLGLMIIGGVLLFQSFRK